MVAGCFHVVASVASVVIVIVVVGVVVAVVVVCLFDDFAAAQLGRAAGAKSI